MNPARGDALPSHGSSGVLTVIFARRGAQGGGKTALHGQNFGGARQNDHRANQGENQKADTSGCVRGGAEFL